MRIPTLPAVLASALASAGAAALALAAPAAAVPECDNFAPNTRICRTPGHTAIITSPDPALTNRYPGWGYGGLGIPAFGLGTGGIWIGF
jgi:hypothetical protein